MSKPVLTYNEDCQEMTVVTDKAYYMYRDVSPEWYEALADTAKSHKPNNIWRVLTTEHWKRKCIKAERR